MLWSGDDRVLIGEWPDVASRLTFEGVNVPPRDRDLVHFAKLPKLALLSLTADRRVTTPRSASRGSALRPDVRLFLDGKKYPAK